MRVNVDEARRDQQAARVDFSMAAIGIRFDCDDAAVVYRDISDARRATGTVDDIAAADDEIVQVYGLIFEVVWGGGILPVGVKGVEEESGLPKKFPPLQVEGEGGDGSTLVLHRGWWTPSPS
jgi:hypothetical protein